MPKKKQKARKAEKPEKLKRPKLIRDSFTIPEDEYKKIRQLKARGLEYGLELKKSELLRAGLAALEAMDRKQFEEIASKVERLKTGRPARDGT